MAGTDINTGHEDANISHDHTYYGKGCKMDEYPQGQDGSPVSCSTNIVSTKDGEPQTMGTYYTYQAATLGTGSTITTNNTNVSDSFCPLGWQMPYSGTGGDYYDKSKSWKYLFDEYEIEIGKNVGYEYVNAMNSYPFSYIKSGHGDSRFARLYRLEGTINFWSITNKSETVAYRTDAWSGTLEVDQTNYKYFEYPIRRVLDF